MHWRKPFPPKRASVLAELIAVLRQSLHPDTAMAKSEDAPADLLPHELPPAVDPVTASQTDH